MRLLVSEAASELISERGGRLFIWTKRGGCCGGAMTRLATSNEAPAGKHFQRVARGEGFDLFLPASLARLPDELHVEARRFPRRLEAYWNGCAWVV